MGDHRELCRMIDGVLDCTSRGKAASSALSVPNQGLRATRFSFPDLGVPVC